MSDPTIFVCKPKAITPNDKAKLSKAGIIVVEMENPQEFKLLKAGIHIDSLACFNAALKALSSHPQSPGEKATTATLQREEFVRLMSAVFDAETRSLQP